jgi:hypothetical protein
LLSKQCGLDIINGVIFENNDMSLIEEGIKNVYKTYTNDMIIKFSKENIAYIEKNFSRNLYEKNIECLLDEIIKDIGRHGTAIS